MMRKCHLNTCPVGIATQDPILREKFAGQPEHVVNFFFLLAEEVRNEMAKLGVTKFQDLIGRTDFVRVRSGTDLSNPTKSKLLYFGAILRSAQAMRPDVNIVGGSVAQDFGLENHLDHKLLKEASVVLDGNSEQVSFSVNVVNSNRAVGTLLSYHIVKKHGEEGLPDGSINIYMTGSAGQSFGAFLAKGIKITLAGDANDYVGKGLSGGEVVIYPPRTSPFRSEKNVIVGNACLYGATSGRVFIRGIAAERFCVRNSGAVAVVEGVGNHGCEYMTGGTVVILGKITSKIYFTMKLKFEFFILFLQRTYGQKFRCWNVRWNRLRSGRQRTIFKILQHVDGGTFTSCHT